MLVSMLSLLDPSTYEVTMHLRMYAQGFRVSGFGFPGSVLGSDIRDARLAWNRDARLEFSEGMGLVHICEPDGAGAGWV
jgi:hypothetical protein